MALIAMSDIRPDQRFYYQFRKAIKNGEITKKPCIFCGDPNAHAHHPDYTKPLTVRWVCRKCHAVRIHSFIQMIKLQGFSMRIVLEILVECGLRGKNLRTIAGDMRPYVVAKRHRHGQ